MYLLAAAATVLALATGVAIGLVVPILRQPGDASAEPHAHLDSAADAWTAGDHADAGMAMNPSADALMPRMATTGQLATLRTATGRDLGRPVLPADDPPPPGRHQ